MVVCRIKFRRLQAGARVEVGDVKRIRWILCYGKQPKANEPSWLSPWGNGRLVGTLSALQCQHAAWVIILIFMVAGGDLQFPHISGNAQSEGATGIEKWHKYMDARRFCVG